MVDDVSSRSSGTLVVKRTAKPLVVEGEIRSIPKKFFKKCVSKGDTQKFKPKTALKQKVKNE